MQTGTRRTPWMAVPVAILLATSPAFSGEGDPLKGEKAFKACKACHKVGAGARNGVGPHLDGLFGRAAGSLKGFKYSKAMLAHGEDGLVWDEAALDAYIADPQVMIPGTRMSFRGMEDEATRADLIAYLKQASVHNPVENPSAEAPLRAEMGAAALAIEGDRDYGAYLATECVTCHQITGQTNGIPSIVGWPKPDFVRALFEYKTNVREHQVMKLMTVNLGNEEIAALAEYFSSLDPQ